MYGKRMYNQGTVNGLLASITYTFVKAITTIHVTKRNAKVEIVRTTRPIISYTGAGWLVSRAVSWVVGHMQTVVNRTGTGVRALPTYSKRLVTEVGHRVRYVIERFVKDIVYTYARKGTAKRPNPTYHRRSMTVLNRFGQARRVGVTYVSTLFQKTVLRGIVNIIRYVRDITHTYTRHGTGERVDTNYVSDIVQVVKGGVAVLKQTILTGIFNIYHRMRVIFDQNSTIAGGVNVDFNMFAGDTKTIVVNVVDGNNVVKNLTGATAKFAMKKSKGAGGSPAVYKTSGSGIVMRTNSFEVNLVPNDTKDLIGDYIYECEVTDAVGYVATVASGTVTIRRSIV